ncbi:16S rRNA (guanine527-N7)-methyltransferase [Actinoplanes cyaneus]|nr:16S rRNA (guanine527-N7)-methyltransferase [Actinoplanes cyaneus]
MTDPRFGAGDLGPGGSTPGPSSFPASSPPSSAGPVSAPPPSVPSFTSSSPAPASSESPAPGAVPPAFPASVPHLPTVSSEVPVSASMDPSETPSSSPSDPPASASYASRPGLSPGGTGSPVPVDLSAVDVRRPPAEIAAVAAEVFGDRLELAGRFTQLLATEGVVRGLIGPRETPRLWERHLVNCGVMSSLFPFGASVVDVGSGAGLPGIVLAVARPDLRITLVEPLARRTAFLTEAVDELGLDNVTVVRGRAEEVLGEVGEADVVTARAVAALDRLAGWCLPLARVGGRLLALKGASAEEEIGEHGAAIARIGGGQPEIRLCGVGLIDPPATVVEIVKEREVAPPARDKGRAAGAGRRSGRGDDRTERGGVGGDGRQRDSGDGARQDRSDGRRGQGDAGGRGQRDGGGRAGQNRSDGRSGQGGGGGGRFGQGGRAGGSGGGASGDGRGGGRGNPRRG